MKNLCILSSLCLLLTACSHATPPETETYARSALLSPQKQAEPAPTPRLTEPTVPLQPVQTPVVQQPYIQQPVIPQPITAVPVQQSTPQSPSLIQTIVIPQATPTYATPVSVLPTSLPQTNIQALPQTIQQPMAQSIPQQMFQPSFQSTALPQQGIVPAQPTPQQTPSVSSTPKVYPSWARVGSEIIPQSVQSDINSAEKMLFFKRAGQNETVQCAFNDVMCIASYQQQGYVQVQPTTNTATPSYSSGFNQQDSNNNIPRW